MKSGKYYRQLVLSTLLVIAVTAQVYAQTLIDDQGTEISLSTPATRVISLAPHLAELLFTAGAGESLIGTVLHSDFPKEVKDLPVVGDVYRLDMERIISMTPDLVIAWESFAGPEIERLRLLGIPVYVSATDSIANIAHTLDHIGKLTGTGQTAHDASVKFSSNLARLEQTYSGKQSVSVFYQFWSDPIYTVNKHHLISELIELCGGSNVFAEMPTVSGTVSLEAVIAANPEVILASGNDANSPEWLQKWHDWPDLQAVKSGHLHHIPPDLIQRPSTRLVDGARKLCEYLESARY